MKTGAARDYARVILNAVAVASILWAAVVTAVPAAADAGDSTDSKSAATSAATSPHGHGGAPRKTRKSHPAQTDSRQADRALSESTPQSSTDSATTGPADNTGTKPTGHDGARDTPAPASGTPSDTTSRSTHLRRSVTSSKDKGTVDDSAADQVGAATEPGSAAGTDPSSEPVSQSATAAKSESTATAEVKAAVTSHGVASKSLVTALTGAATATASLASRVISFVGSIVFNVLGAAIKLVSGKPILPAGSTVSVQTSSLILDTGQTVSADWYFPETIDSSTKLIYLQHGFMATSSMYSYTAATLAEETNSIVVVPALSSNLFDPNGYWIGGAPEQQAIADLFSGDRTALTQSASAAVGYDIALPTDFILVGHSLGGSLVMGAASQMDSDALADLKGVILLDAVDKNSVIANGLQKLSVAVYNISSQPYVWNENARVAKELAAGRPDDFTGVMLVGGRHIDALQGGNSLIQAGEYLIAGTSKSQNVDAVRTLAVGWINDLFNGTDYGIYGAPQESIGISTDHGTATAVVYPLLSTKTVNATPFDGLIKAFLNFLFQFAVYDTDEAL